MAVQIPTLQRRVAPEIQNAPRVAQTSVDSTGLARGLSSLGGALADIARKEEEEANQTALINADNQLGTWQNQALFNPETGAFTRKGSGALGLTQNVLADYDKQQQTIYDSLANEQQKRLFQQSAIQRRSGLEAKLGGYEFQEQQAYKDDVDKSSMQLAMDSAALNYNDPDAVEQNRSKLQGVLQLRAQRNGWSPEETQAQMQAANSGLSQAVIQRMLVDSPQRAKSLFEQYKGGMTAEDQIRATNGIDQGLRRLEAEARQRQIEARQLQAIARVELQSRVQDAQAAYLQGLDFDDPPSRADFNAAYGEKAGEAYESFSKVQAVAPAIREFATATPAERQEIIARFQPAQDGVAREGFQEDDGLFRRLMTVGQGLLKQQQQDPAAYVARYSPAVRSAFQAAQEAGTPEAYRAYANATLAEQQRLGVLSPKLLPDSAADQIVTGFASQSEGGENAATLIEQQQQLWGPNFSRVIQQIGNKLPSEAQVIATGVPKSLAERMASTALLKDDQLFGPLQKGQKAEIQEAIADELAPFAQSLQGQVDGQRTYSTFYDTAVRTAASYVQGGMDPRKAAQTVANGMINEKYEFAETYRIPASLNTSAVRSGAQRVIEDIAPAELAALPGLAGVTPEASQSQLADAVKASGQWVPNNDESGLMLTLNGHRVLDKDGKPIIRTWDQLTEAGTTRRASPFEIVPGQMTP